MHVEAGEVARLGNLLLVKLWRGEASLLTISPGGEVALGSDAEVVAAAEVPPGTGRMLGARYLEMAGLEGAGEGRIELLFGERGGASYAVERTAEGQLRVRLVDRSA
ncbi:MAG: hypothetical protein VYE22_37335 [Myxococcota bacterium]|nr:hypothetical protein [Myxococcota bacterium]